MVVCSVHMCVYQLPGSWAGSCGCISNTPVMTHSPSSVIHTAVPGASVVASEEYESQ